jgi:pimeloyl-ACP methyl ester carboxylesterase
LLVVVALAAIGVFARFLIWRGEIERELVRNGTVAVTAYGPVEYAEIGRGPAVLMIHGTPGGYDQGLSYVKATGLANLGLRYVVPSRPGYLRTPVASGKTPEQQAKLYAALLTNLGISKVAVIGASGGGPSALQFAMMYPERCSALILEEPVTQSLASEKKPTASLVQDFLTFLFRGQLISAWQAKDPRDPAISKIGEVIIESTLPSDRRLTGQLNDFEQVSKIGNWPLSKIHCPTLILHGTADENVPIANSEFAHAQIANSEFVKIQGADHFMVVVRYKEIDHLIDAFIAKHQ